jgi:hypothetical protein
LALNFITLAAIGGSPSENQSLAMIVGWLLLVVFLLALMTMAIVWVKKNYVTLNTSPDERPDDRQLLAQLTQIKGEVTPDVFRAFQRTIVSSDPERLRLAASALQVALERGGAHPGFGNMLLTLGLNDPTEQGLAFLTGAVEVYKKKFGAEHPETATTLAVAALTMARHNFSQAGSYLEQAIQLCQQELPDGTELPKLQTAYDEFQQRQAAAAGSSEENAADGNT